MVHGRIKQAEQKLSVCLYYVTHKDDYIIATDSGGRQRYIIGTLDDGEMFVEKIKKDKLTECYDMEEQW